MHGLNLHHLRYFRAVAHDGNLTRAAERMNLSQSALSVQIRRLEEFLGHALFERRGRRLVLTEAGRIALDHADAIHAAGEELIGTLRETGRSRQALRVGALATLSRNFQAAFLRPVLGRADVEVILRSASQAELMRGLGTLALDVALMTRPPQPDAAMPVVAHRLAEQQASLVGTPTRRIEGARLADLLAAHPMILPTPESGLRPELDALFARLGIRPQIAAEVDDMAMIRLMAREDAGLAVVPPIVVRDELASGRLVELSRLPGIAESFYAVTPERRFPHPLLPLLLEFRAEAAQDATA
ncbi:LysR family transcriptional regulator [Limibaculum sp. FT325]|uniref:LysR family transcriptional regulator n=1 Tax=Thermohalobaculum sediminis TaxID=2939436 RepID=UPI0020BE4277|nr:LysR family transcriptional regulator [Limibaculum sediminis]MCL5776091.1 LysR family transcriptional regulator [Limibaculum sediminis]